MKKDRYKYLVSSAVCLLILVMIGCKQQSNTVEKPLLAKPNSGVIDKNLIDSIHVDISKGEYGLIDHFMIIHKGKVVADFNYDQDYDSIAKQYDTTTNQYNYDHPDWHPYYKESELHTLQSVTKSITSALLGITLEEHPEFNVNTTVMPLFKQYTYDTTDLKKQLITIEDLLTMRSGLKWNENNYDDPENNCVVLEASDKWIDYVLNKPTDTIPGKHFEYNSGASVLLGKAVHLITGIRIDKYAEEKLFKPLGITQYYWKKTPEGEIDTEGGLYLKAEDLAKIGLLFLQKGKWNDKQIISEEWITKSTSPIVHNVNPGDNYEVGYGYQWWISKHQNGISEIYTGNGYGGQYLVVVPEYDLTVLIYGWNIHDVPEKSLWRVLHTKILPSLKKE